MQGCNEAGVLILSDRDRIEYNYMLKIRGEQAIRWAITQLPGNRKPYVSNIAKILMLEIPENLPDPQKIVPIEDGLKILSQVIKTRK